MIRDERGSALVEIALVMPILLLLLCGIVEFGRVFHSYIVVQQAARDAVRYASVGTSDEELENIITSSMATLDGEMSYAVNPSLAEREAGKTVSVEISYDHALLVPYLAGIIPEHIVLHSKLSMRVE